MKKMLMCAAFAAVVGLCLSAAATPIGKWAQPVDTTNPAGQISEVVVTPVPFDDRSADDWKCTDGSPITQINWWGDFHRYLDAQAGTVPPPAVLPISFILRQYANDATDPLNTKPGALITEVEIPIAQCNQAFYQTVSTTLFGQIHIFSYGVTLDTPWTQTKDSIYWLSVQAQYDVDPLVPGPPPGSYLHWEWLNTPPADFLGTGLVSYDAGATWANPSAPDKVNFAFEIASASPVDLIPNKTTFQTTDQIGVTANVAAISTPCYPFVRIVQPNLQTLYFVDGVGFAPGVSPYLGTRAGAVTVQTPIANFPILAAPFSNMPTGTYLLQGGAVDALRTTSVDDLKYVGSVDEERLLIQ